MTPREFSGGTALSEVVGVMLILAITLIIAGIIAAFAGNFTLDTGDDTIQANLVASEISVNDSGNYAYIVFDHISGDPVDLNSIEVHLGLRSSPQNKTGIDNRMEPTGHDQNDDHLTKYLVGYGEDTDRIGVGDRFVLYADGVNSKGIFWQYADATGTFLAQKNDHLTYEIIDTRSQRPVSSGMIAVPDY